MNVRKALLVPIVLLPLAACTGGEPIAAPATLPPVSSTPSSSAAPGVPESARAATPDGAAAFARYYLRVVDEAWAKGQPERLEELSAVGCDTCDNFIRVATENRDQRLTYEGGQTSVLSAEATLDQPGDAVVDVLFSKSASATRDSRGSEVGRSPAQKRVFAQMRVVADPATGWRARAIRFPEVPK